jgi:long-chain acyl-CoA synthetase
MRTCGSTGAAARTIRRSRDPVAPTSRVTPETIPGLLAARVRESPDAPAFLTADASGAWQAVSWAAFAGSAWSLGRALGRSGVGRGTRVAILARTSVEWERAQMAALAAGATVIGIDPHYPDATLAHVLEATAPEVLFVEDPATAARVSAGARAGLRRLFAFRGAGEAGTTPLADVGIGDDAGTEPLLTEARADDDAIVVFSSGTTGAPKPIAYTHRQTRLAVAAILEAFPDIGFGSRLACWLPLANLFQRIINFCAVARGAASYVVADPRAIASHLATIRPHVFIGVPRFFEKVRAGVEERLASAGAPARGLARWAIARGRRRAGARGAGADAAGGPFGRAGLALADRLVLRRVRAVFGAEARYLVSGSAPMPPPLLEWFDAIGLPVLEAYGVSENIVPIAMNRPGAQQRGTVGQPLPQNEVRLAVDGEVLVRGAGVFRGYLGDEAGPRPDAQGFWATGDLGELTAAGYLRLTGRKAEAFKIAAGRWVVPAQIEARFGALPYLEHAAVLRLRADRLVAVLSVDLGRLRGRGSAAGGAPGPAGGAPDAAECETVARDAVAALADLPAALRPSGLLLATRPFSIEGGELTTNLKLRRAAIAERFRPELERLLALLPGTGEPDRGAPAAPVVLAA